LRNYGSVPPAPSSFPSFSPKSEHFHPIRGLSSLWSAKARSVTAVPGDTFSRAMEEPCPGRALSPAGRYLARGPLRRARGEMSTCHLPRGLLSGSRTFCLDHLCENARARAQETVPKPAPTTPLPESASMSRSARNSLSLGKDLEMHSRIVVRLRSKTGAGLRG